MVLSFVVKIFYFRNTITIREGVTRRYLIYEEIVGRNAVGILNKESVQILHFDCSLNVTGEKNGSKKRH